MFTRKIPHFYSLPFLSFVRFFYSFFFLPHSFLYEQFEEDRNSLRSDSESVGFCEVFWVRCQAQRRADAKKKAAEKEQKSDKELELEAV